MSLSQKISHTEQDFERNTAGTSYTYIQIGQVKRKYYKGKAARFLLDAKKGHFNQDPSHTASIMLGV